MRRGFPGTPKARAQSVRGAERSSLTWLFSTTLSLAARPAVELVSMTGPVRSWSMDRPLLTWPACGQSNWRHCWGLADETAWCGWTELDWATSRWVGEPIRSLVVNVRDCCWRNTCPALTLLLVRGASPVTVQRCVSSWMNQLRGFMTPMSPDCLLSLMNLLTRERHSSSSNTTSRSRPALITSLM